MYIRLKMMVNQVRKLGSTKWDDHEMVKVILRSLVFRNPTQVQLIRGDPRYKQMSPDEVIGKFVRFELMIKDSKHIINLEQGATSKPEVNSLPSKQQKRRRKSLHQVHSQSTPPSSSTRRWLLSSRAFDKSSNKGKGRTTNPVPKGCAIGVVSPVTLLQNVHIQVIGTTTRKGRRRWRRKDTTRRRREVRHTWGRNGTPTRAPLTPPSTRMLPTSSSTKGLSSPTSATNASWLRRAKRRRYILEIPPNTLHPMMRVALVMIMMI
jgi:hypothetical protein